MWLLIILRLFALVAVSLSANHFNPIEHLGGISPLFKPHGPPTSAAFPQGCAPIRAAYLVRHAAIHANDNDYKYYIGPFIRKWQNTAGIDWSKVSTLRFLANWSSPISKAEGELLTPLGKLEATELGISLSIRYPNFRPPQRIWASSAERTVQSAQAIARGFGLQENAINVVTVDEGKRAGANSLTPYDSCPAYSSSAGSQQFLAQFIFFTSPIVARLRALVPEFGFTAKDIYGMMELCGYESVIRSTSPFCNLDLFAADDWLGWEYASDIMAHHNVGYGNHVSGAIGLPWLRATANLLLGANNDEYPTQDLYVSLTHRKLLPTVLVAMGLFNNSAQSDGPLGVNETMPVGRINPQRAWKSSQIFPFLGNIAIERLKCVGTSGFLDGEYYRVLVNNASQQLPACDDGPGTSCSRQAFEAYVQDRVSLFGGYSAKCGVNHSNATDAMTLYTDPSIGNGTLVRKMSAWE